MNDSELHNWGMQFVNLIDEFVQRPGNEELKESWMEGDFEYVKDHCKLFTGLSDDQLEWVEDFVSEI